MRFLIDANMPRSTSALFKRYGHDAMDVRDRGMGASPDETIAFAARNEGLVIVTRDTDFGDIRTYPPQEYSGIVVIELPPTATAAFVLRVVEEFLKHIDEVRDRVGWLAILEGGQMRLRLA